MKKISFGYFDTFYHSFVRSPLDEHDGVQFLMFENYKNRIKGAAL